MNFLLSQFVVGCLLPVCCWLFAVGCWLLFVVRNDKVCNYRLKLLDWIKSQFKEVTFSEQMLMLKVFNSVSYLKMLFQFWRSFNSFYKGTILEGWNK